MAHWMGRETMTSIPKDFEEEQDHGTKCDYCDFLIESDEIRQTFGDEDSICPNCMDDFDFVECRCGAVFEKDEVMTCPECGHQIGKDDE